MITDRSCENNGRDVIGGDEMTNSASVTMTSTLEASVRQAVKSTRVSRYQLKFQRMVVCNFIEEIIISLQVCQELTPTFRDMSDQSTSQAMTTNQRQIITTIFSISPNKPKHNRSRNITRQ